MSQPEQRQYGTAETGGSCGIQRRMSRDPYGRPAAAGWNAATGYGTERTARRKSSDRWTADPPADGAESAGRLYCRKSFTNDAVSGYELFAESHVLPASADRQLVSPAEHLPQPYSARSKPKFVMLSARAAASVAGSTAMPCNAKLVPWGNSIASK